MVFVFAGKLSMKFFATYSTSKFALDGFFGAYRQEISHKKVSITNCVLGTIGKYYICLELCKNNCMGSGSVPSNFSHVKFWVSAEITTLTACKSRKLNGFRITWLLYWSNKDHLTINQ